ncbi:MAG TPA: efflux RND transporter periplasmic adaptor subunit [Pirellulales bacterium]|nr:efflux RND transporter periplasmic adaptor subunit [Pirellulales bacterium]
MIIGASVAAVVGLIILVRKIVVALTTVSTDDAYVNGHFTLVAPRVPGQVIRVLVDDNYRVKKGDLLVELDKEPYRVQLAMRRDALTVAERDLEQVKAQTHSQVAELRANVATLNRQMATAALDRFNLSRGELLTPKGAMSREELDRRRQTLKADEAAVEEALHAVYASRLGLGLAARPGPGHDLAETPLDLAGNLPNHVEFDPVYAAAVESAASVISMDARKPEAKALPQEAHRELERFYDQLVQEAPKPLSQEAQQALERVYDRLVEEAPAVKQAAAKVPQARDELAQAELNLHYCDVVSDIDGQVTSRNVNPGDYVQAGQNVFAVRSLREIWIDANFKETQLAYLRIGQRVRCEVDMYGSWHEFEGRITGFEMGTGQTLALLPPQNATGNFVKIVQRLPVRIELTDYQPDINPLFVGLSVEPYVYYKEPAQGPNAGQMLRPISKLPQLPPVPRASLPLEDQPQAAGSRP